jgi:hypothetical protein
VSDEQIIFEIPAGMASLELLTECAHIAMWFSHQHADRSWGLKNAVTYTDIRPGFDATVYWDRAKKTNRALVLHLHAKKGNT